MKLRLAALMFVFVAACSSEPPPPDMKNPVSVASAFVAAYNTKDLARMLPLVDQVNLDSVKDALAGGPSSEAYRDIFMPEVADLMAREGGKVVGPRYERHGKRWTAIVSVGKSDHGFVYAIVLDADEDGEWKIAENSTMPEDEFLSLPEQPKR